MTMPAVAPPSLPPLPPLPLCALLPTDVGTTATTEALGVVMEPLLGEALGRSGPAPTPRDELALGTGRQVVERPVFAASGVDVSHAVCLCTARGWCDPAGHLVQRACGDGPPASIVGSSYRSSTPH